jgi:hypothetical protein
MSAACRSYAYYLSLCSSRIYHMSKSKKIETQMKPKLKWEILAAAEAAARQSKIIRVHPFSYSTMAARGKGWVKAFRKDALPYETVLS